MILRPFLFFLILTTHLAAYGSNADFINSYLEVNGYIKINKLNQELGDSAMRSWDKFYNSRFVFEPQKTTSDFQFPGGTNYTQTTYQFNSRLTSDFKTGTSLSFLHRYNLAERSDRDQKQKNSRFEINLEQSLYQNFFGKRYQLESTLEKKFLNRTLLEGRIETLKACHEAYKKLNDAYYAQEREKTLKKIYNSSQSIYYDMHRKFKEKIIDTLTYQETKVDYLSRKDDYINGQNSYALLKDEIKRYTSNEAPITPLEFELPEKETSLELRKQVELTEFYLAQNALIKRRNSWDVSFKTGYIDINQENDYSFSVEGDNNTKNFYAGLSLDIPLLNSRLNHQKNEDKIRASISELELTRLTNLYEIESAKFFQNLELVKQDLKRLKKNNSEHSKLNSLARQSFAKRAINFQRYQEIRNQYYQNQLVILEKEYFTNKLILDWANLTSSSLSYCKELL